MRAFFNFFAICAGFFTGTVAFRYAAYKVAVGPEEEPDRKLLDMGLVRGMACCMDKGSGVWIVRVLAMALWVLTLYVMDGGWLFVIYSACISLLLGLSYVDIKINELPPLLNVLIALLGVIRVLMDLEHWYVYIIGAVAVSGLFLLIGLFSKGRAMGGGDVKLMAALGLLLGWQKVILVLLLGAVLGSVIHGIMMIARKEGHVLAFGPYLAAGAVISMLWGDKLISVYLNMILPH